MQKSTFNICHNSNNHHRQMWSCLNINRQYFYNMMTKLNGIAFTTANLLYVNYQYICMPQLYINQQNDQLPICNHITIRSEPMKKDHNLLDTSSHIPIDTVLFDEKYYRLKRVLRGKLTSSFIMR